MSTPPCWPATQPTLMSQLRDDAAHGAWSTFVTLYAPMILRYCRRKGLQEADAQDIAQEVLFKVRRFEYDPERGRFRAWLATVTRREIGRFQRNEDRAGRLEVAEGPGGPAARGADPDWDRVYRARLLEYALERVRLAYSREEWRAFEGVAVRMVDSGGIATLSWVDDPPYRQVARELGRPLGWVYKVKCKMLRRLRAEVLYLAEDLAILL